MNARADAARLLDALDVFFGDVHAAEARVYARLQASVTRNGLQWSGQVTGPACEYSRTLPARIPLNRVDAAGPPLALAIVPDPCFWSPRLPFLYEVDVELRHEGEVIARTSRMVGLRTLGARGRQLRMEGKSWVVRGVRQTTADWPLAQWHAAGLAMFVTQPDDEMCEQASRQGVLIAAQVSVPSERVPGELRRLARWPAVGLAVLPCGLLAGSDLRAVAPNLLLAQRFAAGEVVSPAAWCQAAVCEAADVDSFCRSTADCAVPVIALREAALPPAIDEVRTLCDRLQRDLAGRGEFAGYVV